MSTEPGPNSGENINNLSLEEIKLRLEALNQKFDELDGHSFSSIGNPVEFKKTLDGVVVKNIISSGRNFAVAKMKVERMLKILNEISALKSKETLLTPKTPKV
ncbi:hypothetical protein A2738_02165 [Candidatus Nomurabacteria bacterium RIFCSPHIGHO2_01_FULL_42_15]|uniref:Uncharacterized protein n=1 Tax=Candidatus Nomurabacteria bacterium RIFCSPHIGHO2_01_FULL_42_15 TaxID=1801742 RepID=A0A1F6VF79_9BACT|nr:MAG: hypothetical protein A2738_02165 [Candidatus Nomurabacteria bacterium RIFCSPHIGHO2_01_FULL_42_15]OGI93409.1 MAG: hypothetical protein A3A99_01895 [Candidatus Nomurabacteria bacterium RIFCSPLOWO2_01_FULL_41_18]